MYQNEEEDEILYEVEKILGVRYDKERHQVQFLIKWKNYDSRWWSVLYNDNTWEQEDNLECPMLLKQFWDTLNIGSDTKRLIYEGKKRKIMIPSAESQDDIYEDDGDDDYFMDDLSYESQPKASRPAPVLQSKQPVNQHIVRTRQEKGKQRYQPPQQQQRQQKQFRELRQNQKLVDGRQEQCPPPHHKLHSPDKRPCSSSSYIPSASSISSSTISSSSSSYSSTSTPIPMSNSWKMSHRARLEAEVDARIGKNKSEAPIQRKPIKNVNIVSYKNRMLSEPRTSLSSSSPTISVRKRAHTYDYLSIKASKTEKKQSPASFTDIDTLFNRVQDNKKDRHRNRYT